MPSTFRQFSLSAFVIFWSVLNPQILSADDWPRYRHDLGNTGASPETGISSLNVASLQLKWSLATGAAISGSPAVATINGTSVVFAGNWNGYFYAVNAVTGQQLWSFKVDSTPYCTNCLIGSSPAVSNGIVYFGADNAFLYALNASTGALVWKVQLGDPSQGAAIWSSPAVYNNIVYVGVASHGDVPCVVGQVVARNASTGAAIWNFSAIDQTSCNGGQCVGAGVWASPALDTTNGILYVGTGNPGSTCSPSTPNATRYPDSVLALRMADGTLVNYYQAITNDTSDDDFGSSPVLYTNNYVNCSNVRFITNYVAEASKNGSVYVLARSSSGLGPPATVYALDLNGFVASPAVNIAAASADCGERDPYSQSWNLGQLWLPSGNVSGGYLYRTSVGISTRYYPAALESQFSISPPQPIYSAPAIVRDVALFGSSDHHLYAVNVPNGTMLWSYAAGASINSGPAVSNGRVYVGSDDGYLRCFSVNGQ